MPSCCRARRREELGVDRCRRNLESRGYCAATRLGASAARCSPGHRPGLRMGREPRMSAILHCAVRGDGIQAGCPSGQRERSVKPSAQPTLVRTQHLPPPAQMARDRRLCGRGLFLCMPSACRWFPAIYGYARNHGETPSQLGLFVQGLVKVAVPQLLVAVEASGVNTQQYGDAAPGPPTPPDQNDPAPPRAPPPARQRLVHQTAATGLRVRVHLRNLQLLPDQHRIPARPDRQRDHAATHGQTSHQELFARLLSHIDDNQAS